MRQTKESDHYILIGARNESDLNLRDGATHVSSHPIADESTANRLGSQAEGRGVDHCAKAARHDDAVER